MTIAMESGMFLFFPQGNDTPGSTSQRSKPCQTVSPLSHLMVRNSMLSPSGPGAPTHVVLTIIVTFPRYLRPTLAPIALSEPGLWAKRIFDLYEIIGAKTGYSSSNSKLTIEGQNLKAGQTLAKYNVSSGDAIMVMPASRPRKRVIYLYSPSSLSHVIVQLSLTPSWCFSAVYPPPQPVMPYDFNLPNPSPGPSQRSRMAF